MRRALAAAGLTGTIAFAVGYLLLSYCAVGPSPMSPEPDEVILVVPDRLDVGSSEAWSVERYGESYVVCVDGPDGRGYVDVGEIDFATPFVKLLLDTYRAASCSVDWTLNGETLLKGATGWVVITGGVARDRTT